MKNLAKTWLRRSRKAVKYSHSHKDWYKKRGQTNDIPNFRCQKAINRCKPQNDSQSDNKRVKPGDSGLMSRKGVQRIEHPFS